MTRELTDLLHRARVLILYVGNGDWSAQDPAWRMAAEKWIEDWNLERLKTEGPAHFCPIGPATRARVEGTEPPPRKEVDLADEDCDYPACDPRADPHMPGGALYQGDDYTGCAD